MLRPRVHSKEREERERREQDDRVREERERLERKEQTKREREEHKQREKDAENKEACLSCSAGIGAFVAVIFAASAAFGLTLGAAYANFGVIGFGVAFVVVGAVGAILEHVRRSKKK